MLGTGNFTLRENTLGAPPEQALKARQEVLEKYSPDWLGAKQPQYTTTSFVEQSKFTDRHQQAHLSSTIDKTTFKRVIGAEDYATYTSSTIKHPPQHAGGPPVRSITFTKREFSGPWNQSTSPSYKDFALAQAAIDEKAMAATMKKTTKLLTEYISPQEREVARMEAMRAQKRERLQYRRALEELYGPEGAKEVLAVQELAR